jgi:thymidylate synthase (FAD)
MDTINVLDYGYVKLLNLSGPTRRLSSLFDADDTDPANSARMSFDQKDSNRPREDDLKLCKYLYKNKHTTPFEMIEVWLEMKLPIFVARQFVRHRTVSINEISGRYVTLPEEYYIPEPDKVTTKAKYNKQGRSDQISPHCLDYRIDLEKACKNSYKKYLQYLNEGIAPEICRNFLHVNHYTKWLWKQDLHNILHLITLRKDNHAQWESQQYALAIEALLTKYLPDLMIIYRESQQ